MRHLWDALSHAYDVLGFDTAADGDEAFRCLVLARIIEPTTKRDSLRGLEEVGIRPPSYPTVNRRLPVFATRGDQLIGNANSAGLDTCQYNGIVFFAGRGVPDYGDFISSAAQCLSKAVFLAGDDVSRYVADATTRENTRALSYYYLSFAFAPPVKDLQGPQLDFYNTLYQLFPFENDPSTNRSLDGHEALSFDAADVLITAVSYLRSGSQDIPITPAAVWREVTDIHGSQAQHWLIDGVSGTIDYGGDIT